MIEEYLVGEEKPPWWVKRGLSAYKKNDGSIGYEFINGRVHILLNRGDVLTNEDGKVRRRKGVNHERYNERDESFPEQNREA